MVAVILLFFAQEGGLLLEGLLFLTQEGWLLLLYDGV